MVILQPKGPQTIHLGAGMRQFETSALMCLCARTHMYSVCIWVHESLLFSCVLPKEQKGLFAMPLAPIVTMNPTLVQIPLQFLIPSSGCFPKMIPLFVDSTKTCSDP